MIRRIAALAVLLSLVALAAWFGPWLSRSREPIRVGLLHSKTGPLAISERAMIEAEVLALEELRAGGGLLGRDIQWIEADGRSDPETFAREARRLVESEKVSVIFGGWTSLSRRKMKAVVERAGILLFFPSGYEGMDQTTHVVCTGPLPNQQVIPAVNWAFETLKARKYFLAGSADIWSYSSNAIIKDQLKALGATTSGEKYVALDGTGAADLVKAVAAAKPDVVISTIIGDGNKPFYEEMARAGLSSQRMPVISFTIAEAELRSLPLKDMVGGYAAWNYFQSVPGPVNRDFVRKFQARYDAERSTSDSVVAAYNAVQLWAQAVVEAGVEASEEVRKTIRHQSLQAPEGIVSIDEDNLHIWRPLYVGKIRPDGQFDIVWSLEKPVRPVPYPVLRPRGEWSAFVEKLYTTWGTRDFDPQTLFLPVRPQMELARYPARTGSEPRFGSASFPARLPISLQQ